MSFQHFLPLIFLSLVFFIVVVPVKNQSLSVPELFRACNRPFICGNFTVYYPFWGNGRVQDCGFRELELRCWKDRPIMEINDVYYVILDVNVKAKTFRVARTDYLNGICSPRLINTTLNSQTISYVSGYEMVSILYACPLSASLSGHFTCFFTGTDYKDGYIVAGASGPGSCFASVSVPIPKTSLPTSKGKPSVFDRTLRDGFELKWDVGEVDCEKCRESSGICAYSLGQTSCYCRNGQSSNSRVCYIPSNSSGSNDQNKENKPFFNKSRKISIGITASLVGIIILSILLVGSRRLWTKKTEDDQRIEAFFRTCPSPAPQRYSYSDVKTMTQSFSNKLGRGGYGDVYKGKLADGHLVAVKVLKESRGNGEEFINEVVSISQTSHVNIVTLRGFCFERKRRALIYEFLANGSLDKFIYNQESSSPKCNLEWKTMYQIAIGIARGLEYLHRGCNTRIVHFDIKPHNILLDENFCPKISDFGLAKQSNKRESIMSMLHARGTVGYIAPEVFCRNFGGVSYKSDVYSYGMMTLEIVGGRKNINLTVSHTSEIYFPDSVYKLLEPRNDYKLLGVATEEEEEMAKKMILVSLWCIQTNPSDRPSMSRVVEMLEGSLEDLQIPPKPYLSSPPRSPNYISTISSLTELASEEEQCIRLSDISQN